MVQGEQHTMDEQQAATAFSKQSAIFDAIYTPNKIIQYKRARVRAQVERFLAPGSHILELNAGTGEDTVYFAAAGHHVHATDLAEGMLEKLAAKVKAHQLNDRVSVEKCSFNALPSLQHKGPYDLIFSNFAGLNCTGQLDQVLHSFGPLLKPKGQITLAILPPFCLWETLLALRGHFKTAFRRFNSKNGVTAYVEGVPFTCWYYKPSFITSTLQQDYEVLGLEGLCSIVPPSYLESFPDKLPRLYRFLMKLENRFKSRWPWKYIGDYYIITLRKK
ncbi:Methyltransferase domain-containing protein [Chitinophaga rupis]|uniref:Methyltransferase domain-containing protein n=1 Tax=Chitinophaga rupis TaxID=573321 RepID=A0A1H7XGR0_9BACT|nr:class I SAM-dependent methyltransferase [Chitinophaga rupis]SEM32950.1 Methyltransferase domain-containing protein [Chitinophaga rupis]